MNWKKARIKIEYYIDKIIPYVLILLFILLVIDFGFHDFAKRNIIIMEFLHGFVVFIFVLDLFFKYLRIRKLKNFLKECWLDIIAVFPFYLFFRIFEEFYFFAAEELPRWQAVLHAERETQEFVAELEKTGKIRRFERFLRLRRFIRPLLRTPRLLKAMVFYEKPEK